MEFTNDSVDGRQEKYRPFATPPEFAGRPYCQSKYFVGWKIPVVHSGFHRNSMVDHSGYAMPVALGMARADPCAGGPRYAPHCMQTPW